MKNRRHCVLHLWWWNAVTIKYTTKNSYQRDSCVFFNYFPHSCRPHGLFPFVPYKIIVTDSHCVKWWSERRFQTKFMHIAQAHICNLTSKSSSNECAFAISLFDTRMNRIKIVICVNLFMRKYRNNVNYMKYVMNLCDVL